TNDDSTTPPPVTGDRWGKAFYAPYVDMGGWPVPDLLAVSQTNGGGSLFTAAFMQATPDGRLAWAGLNALEPSAANDQAQSINRSIKALQAAGGDVMISLGGQAGTSLAQWGATRGMTAAQLAGAYAGVIDTYGVNHLDFDIEGAAVADPASIALHSQALKLLQQSKPAVQIWYTLPVLPSGLTADGLKVVDSALKAGVTLAGVNVMAMDYGESAAPTSGPSAKSMGAYAIQSAESTYSQLSKLYGGYGRKFAYSQLGVTPMLGVNDITTEVFTLADAQAVEDYARAKGLGMVALWSVTRDTPGPLGVSTYTHSGMSAPAGSFARLFNDYGTINTLTYPGSGTGGGSNPPVTGGTTTKITWSWGTDTVLNFKTSADKLDFGWFQPANFDVTEVSGSTKVTIVGNNQSYTLSGVPLGQMSINNIIALDSNTVAKWQNAIANAGVSAPTLSIAGATVVEGNSGSTTMPFTVALSKASTAPVTVGYATANGTATAGQDYTAATGTLTFAPGVTTQTVNVGVTGDTTAEPTETFTLTLTNPSGAVVASAVATGTITDDDVVATLPTVSIANASVTEGNSGTATMAFTVSLSKAAAGAVTVGYATANGTAGAGQDYTATSGTLTFAPGVTTQTVNVGVTGDTTAEPSETFTLTLTNPSGAVLASAVATGTITDDDAAGLPITAQNKVMAAYFPEWGIYGRNFQVADVPADQLTHLIYAFLNVTPAGEVAIYDSFAAVDKRFAASETVSGEADQWYYPPSDPRSTQTVWGNFNQLAQLKQKYPHLRVNIAIGGWTLSRNFSTAVSTAAGREKLATSIVNFLDTYRMFDGVDFDWEYPGGGGLDGNSASPGDGANYAALLKLLRTKLDVLGQQQGRRYEITVASPAGYDKIANFNLAGLAPSVDFFNLMSYDFHGTWEKTTGHQSAFTGDPNGYDIQTAVGLYLKAGVTPNKIVLGAPLYTRGWSGVADGGDGGYLESSSGGAPGTFEAGVYDYKDLLRQLQDPAGGWKLYWDDNAQAAYLYNGAQKLFSSFETPTSIAQKAQWAQGLGLRGMMFWDITNDALDSPESLVRAAYSSWVLHDDLARIRSRSNLKGEMVIGGDGVITTLPAGTSAKV
ncbi:MAG: glycosyl hydrolase family 18 protein, partial [Mycobacterium sp.]